MTLPRVVYLSDTDLGREMLGLLQQQPCELVLVNTDNWKPQVFPDYDLGISFLYTHRIPETEFATPYKWVNFHPAPLPEYGGRNLAYHAIMEDARQFGATVHYMDKDFDTGELIEVRRFPILWSDTAGDLVRLAKRNLVDLFRCWVPALLTGKVPCRSQMGKTRYYKKAPIEDCINLTHQQGRLLKALTVHPVHHARIVIGGKKYKIIPEEGS